MNTMLFLLFLGVMVVGVLGTIKEHFRSGRTSVLHVCAIILAVLGIIVLATNIAKAKVVTVPDALSYVDYAQGSGDYGDLGKMYDANANVVCYVLGTKTYNGNAISCVSLK